SDQETLDNYFQQENDDIYEISSITPELSNNKRKHAVRRDEKTRGHYEAICKYCHQRWDRAYPTKFVSCCGIQLGVVENPFSIDFVKNLKPSYDLPSRIKLKDTLIEEVAIINVKITNELEKLTT
ncbi:9940_t:CDS:2, partial [Entrophospora sp. SA101]